MVGEEVGREAEGGMVGWACGSHSPLQLLGRLPFSLIRMWRPRNPPHNGIRMIKCYCSLEQGSQLPCFHSVPWDFYGCDNDPKDLREERVYFSLQVSGHTPSPREVSTGTSRRHLKQRPWMLPWLATVHRPGPPGQDWHHPQLD